MEQEIEKKPVIRLGQENAPVLIDLQKENEESLFSSVYKETYHKIAEYIKAVKERETLYDNNKNNPLYRNENYNNIFAFCGERGSGKTSCMQTVAYNINFRLKDKDKFEILDVIDPSFFDSTHNILELAISQLFKEFTKKLEQHSCHCNNQESIQNKKRGLIKQFQIVKENITNLEAKFDPDETIESLAKLSASMDLGKSIFDLVDKYLEFCDNSGFLVIQIDDIDLNTEHAYKMIEQIRKYLIQSNIIILMAAKLEQLNDVVKLDYQIKFEKLIQAKMMNGDISDYAQKYLLKLIPEDRRLFIPQISNYAKMDILIYNFKNEVEIIDGEKVISIIKYIKGLVNSTLHIYPESLGIPEEHYEKLFVPKTLREFLNICKKIDYKKSDKNRTVSYLDYLEYADMKHLHKSYIMDLFNVSSSEVTQKAIYILRSIFMEYLERCDKSLKDKAIQEFNELQEWTFGADHTKIIKKNISSNPSIYQVIALINYIESLTLDEEILLCTKWIEFIYSYRIGNEESLINIGKLFPITNLFSSDIPDKSKVMTYSLVGSIDEIISLLVEDKRQVEVVVKEKEAKIHNLKVQHNHQIFQTLLSDKAKEKKSVSDKLENLKVEIENNIITINRKEEIIPINVLESSSTLTQAEYIIKQLKKKTPTQQKLYNKLLEYDNCLNEFQIISKRLNIFEDEIRHRFLRGIDYKQSEAINELEKQIESNRYIIDNLERIIESFGELKGTDYEKDFFRIIKILSDFYSPDNQFDVSFLLNKQQWLGHNYFLVKYITNIIKTQSEFLVDNSNFTYILLDLFRSFHMYTNYSIGDVQILYDYLNNEHTKTPESIAFFDVYNSLFIKN